jgi:anti-sigma factor RsiW
MRHVLGTLPDAERVRLEERYFADDAEFEEIEIAEEELIDRYVRGELSASDRAAFEQTVARSPRLMERVEFAKLFAGKLRVAEAPPVVTRAVEPKEANWWEGLFGFSQASRLAFASSILLVLIAGGVLLFGWWQLRAESRRLAAQQAALEQRQRELDQQAADLKAQRQPTPSQTPVPPQLLQEPTPQTAAPALLVLSPGATRSTSGPSNVRILPGTSDVLVTLNLRGTDYSSYRLKLNAPDGKDVFSQAGLKPRFTKNRAVLTFRVPSQRLSQGDYYITLFGEPTNESIDDYSFRVIKQ